MGTTPTVPKRPSKRRFAWQIPLGLAFSTGAFVFGAFMVLPAVLAVVPGLRRFWPMGAALFFGVLGVRGLDLAGVNPAVAYARASIVADLETALGGEVRYDGFSGDVPAGRLLFRGVTADVPALEGRLTVDEIAIEAGFALLFRADGYKATLAGLSAEVDPADGRLERFMEGLESPTEARVRLVVKDGEVSLKGEATSAVVRLGDVQGEFTPDGWNLDVGVRHVDLKHLGHVHSLSVQGGISLSGGEGLVVRMAAGVHEPDLGRMVLNGVLQSGREGRIRCTIDRLALHPLWARYRKIDEYHGHARGDVWISGDLSALALELDLVVEDYGYYHRTFMDLDRERTFRIPEAEITGGITVHDGENWEFRDVAVTALTTTLATGRYITADGGGRLVLRGDFPQLKGRLEAIVTGGRINRAISWSPVGSASLRDLEPNLVQVGEQFEALELDWSVDVAGLEVNSAPLAGVLTGKLEGVYVKTPGERGRISAEGELKLEDGRFNFCAARGEVTGSILFQKNRPPQRAMIRGELTGTAGEAQLAAGVTGSLARPVIAFRGLDMSPLDLGRRIVSHGDLPTGELARRREELVRLCGPSAARNDNPFEATHSGKVMFDFAD